MSQFSHKCADDMGVTKSGRIFFPPKIAELKKSKKPINKQQ